MKNIEHRATPEAAGEDLNGLLYQIGSQLHALRDIGLNVIAVEHQADPVTLGLCVEALANRAGRLVDRILVQRGNPGIGGFRDSAD